LKLLQERVGNTLEHTGIENNFLNRAPVTQQLRERIVKWDYMKLKSFAQQRKQSPDLRGSPQKGRKSSSAIHLTRDLISNQNLQGAEKTKLLKNQ
jgi:hypothetical protein